MVELTVSGETNTVVDYQQFTKDEYFIYLILQNHNQRNSLILKPFCDYFNYTIADLKQFLSDLKQRKLINYDVMAKSSGIEIAVELLKTSVNLENNLLNQLNDIYYFTSEQIKTIEEQVIVDNQFKFEYFKAITLNIVNKNQLEIKNQSFTINSEEDAIEFFNSAAPHEIFASWNINLTNKDKIFVFETIFEQRHPKSLVNLIIDYTIKTNMYHAFNQEFAYRNLRLWQENDIKDVKSALKFIRGQKERIHNLKMKGKYEEPTWEKVDIDEEKVVSVEELEALLNG